MFLARRSTPDPHDLEDVTVEEFDEATGRRAGSTPRPPLGGRLMGIRRTGDTRVFTADGEEVTQLRPSGAGLRGATAGRSRSSGSCSRRRCAYRELGRYIAAAPGQRQRRARSGRPAPAQDRLPVRDSHHDAARVHRSPRARAEAGFALSFAAALAISFFYYGVLQVGPGPGQPGHTRRRCWQHGSPTSSSPESASWLLHDAPK